MALKKKTRELKYSSAKERIKKHESGGDRGSIKVPDNCEIFAFDKEGTYRLDVLPYQVGKGNPYADEGVLHYERTYHVHRGVGPESKSFCCLAKTFGKPCPICDHVNTLIRQGENPKNLKAWKPSERQLWAVIDTKDRDKGVQILDQSNFLFGKAIDAKISAADPEDGYENFFHLQGGKTLKIHVVEESFEGRSYRKADDIEFKDRSEDYDESILDEVPRLDDLLNELSYKELKKIFEMTGGQTDEPEDEDDEDDTSPKKASASRNGTAKKTTVKDDSDDDDDDSEDDTPKKKSVTKATTKKKPDPDEDEDEDEPEDPSDLEDDEDDPDSEDEPEDEDEEEEELPKKRTNRKK